MPISIVGGSTGSEREAAEALRNLLNPIVGPYHQLLIVVSAQCYGEIVKDIDLLLLGSFGQGIPFKSSHGDTCGQTIKLFNLCLIVEVKDHPSEKVRFDSQHVMVHYARYNTWEDVTNKVFQQRVSLTNFLTRHKLQSPRCEGLIWLRNYDKPIPQSAANVLGANPTASDFLSLVEKNRTPKVGNQGLYIAFSTNADVKAIHKAAAFFHQIITPTNLDRKRLEFICKKLLYQIKSMLTVWVSSFLFFADVEVVEKQYIYCGWQRTSMTMATASCF